MSVPLFDTHATVKKLAGAGMPEPQAEVLVQTLSELTLGHLVTKEDLAAAVGEFRADIEPLRSELGANMQQLRSELHAEIQQLRSEVHAEIQQLRSEVLVKIKDLEMSIAERLRGQMLWFFSMLVAVVGLAVAVIKLF